MIPVFAGPVVRTGLLWKIPLDGTLRLFPIMHKQCRPKNNKHKEERKFNRKNGRELSDDKLYTINLFC
jgi:hypothetical protein